MTYWHQFDASVPGGQRVKQVVDWLALPAAQRPHMITLYFEDVDTVTHEHGPGSAQSIASIERVDRYLAQLQQGIDSLPIADDVYLVVVSDHGQAAYFEDEGPFVIDTVADLDDIIVVDHGTAAFLYLREPDDARARSIRDAINASWEHGKAMLPADAPSAWHLTANRGIADVIVLADPNYKVYSSGDGTGHTSKGDHGWAPEFKDMHGIFLASGPRLPAGMRIAPIHNVDVYPLLMEILELPITTPIDGDPDVLTRLLQPTLDP